MCPITQTKLCTIPLHSITKDHFNSKSSYLPTFHNTQTQTTISINPTKIQFNLIGFNPNQTPELKIQPNYRINERGFQISMLPSTSPPAISPSPNLSVPASVGLDQDNRLNRSELGDSPTTGRSRSSD